MYSIFEVISANEFLNIKDVIVLMVKYNLGGLSIISEDGVVTKRDIAFLIAEN
jgi:CBS domain-containing protein